MGRNTNFDISELTADIHQKNRNEEVKRLVEKWEGTGLLEGLNDSRRHKAKSNMAVLLESQAGSLLSEQSQVADIIGFQNVAFPIVRRVFGGLIANELVSVQPMSLPSGLLFYLDYRFDSAKAGNQADDFAVGGSVFGDFTDPGVESLANKGLYNFGTSFSQREKVSAATFSGTLAAATISDVSHDPELSGNLPNIQVLTVTNAYAELAGSGSDGTVTGVKHWVPLDSSSTSASATSDGAPVQLGTYVIYRRHTTRDGNDLKFVVSGSGATTGMKMSYLASSTLTGGTSGTLVLPNFESDMATSPTPSIPEIDLRIQSVPVTADTRKLRARWTPELAQDMAAYQNMDAEVELTQILSEQIALEIDREILAELLYGATGANYHWSRKPGKFLDKTTGNTVTGASFTGTVREWYETLVETVIDVANTIHRKTLRGAANFVVTSTDVSTIFEASVLYKPALSMDPQESQFTVGAEKIGSLNNRFTVYKDPYFPRNKILVGFKGSNFLETGFVYAPYVPLIVTPTIYAPEDFTPRKGVMTRYAKKMVRSDFYGTVTVQDLNVI